MKRSALAHAPLQIKQKQNNGLTFYARDVRRLIRGGGWRGGVGRRAGCGDGRHHLPVRGVGGTPLASEKHALFHMKSMVMVIMMMMVVMMMMLMMVVVMVVVVMMMMRRLS